MMTMTKPNRGIDGTRKLHLGILADASLEDLLGEIRARVERPAP